MLKVGTIQEIIHEDLPNSVSLYALFRGAKGVILRLSISMMIFEIQFRSLVLGEICLNTPPIASLPFFLSPHGA